MKAATYYFATRVAAALLGILGIVFFTRLLTPDEYGVYSLTLAAVAALYAFVFQWVRASLLRYLPSQEGILSPPMAATTVTYALMSVAVLFGAALLVLFTREALSVHLIIAGAAMLLSFAAVEIVLAVLQSRQKPRAYAIVTIGRAIGILGFGSVLAVAGLGAYGLMIGYIFADCLPLLFIVSRVVPILSSLPYSNAQLRSFVQFGWAMAFVGIAGSIIALSDRYMLAWLVDTAEAGIYGAPYDLANRTLSMLMLSAFLAFSPAIFRAFDRGNRQDADDAIVAQCRLMIITGIPVGVLMAVTAPLIAQLFFGSEFRDGAITVFPWIAISSVIQGFITYYLSLGYTLTKNVGANALIVVAAALFNIVLNLALIPPFGAVGAAIATFVTYLALFITSSLVIRRWIHLPFPKDDLFKVLAICAIVAPIAYIVSRMDGLMIALGGVSAVGFLTVASIILLNVGSSRDFFLANRS